MSRITSYYDPDLDLTVFTVEGRVAFDEIWKKSSDFMMNKPSQCTLWDFSSGTAASLSSGEVEAIAERGAKIPVPFDNGRCAILTPQDVDFGIGRMFETFSELSHFPFSIAVFRDLKTAREWLLTSE